MIGPSFPYALLVAALALILPALLAVLSAPLAVGNGGASGIIDAESGPVAQARRHHPARALIASPLCRGAIFDDEDDDADLTLTRRWRA